MIWSSLLPRPTQGDPIDGGQRTMRSSPPACTWRGGGSRQGRDGGGSARRRRGVEVRGGVTRRSIKAAMRFRWTTSANESP
jgi:hypothetical protein